NPHRRYSPQAPARGTIRCDSEADSEGSELLLQSGWEKARLIWTIYVPPEENPSGGIFILLLACMCLAEQRE
ncbi:hypothetical protein, partial [Selenomonas noxia]|uniref:hypothetical protein n=1 Tax=Selenomonas noxia TaxID=135083 RepID=UPI003C766485